MLPPLTTDGLLPPGVHAADWPALNAQFGYNPRRRVLLASFRDLCAVLGFAGCPTVWLDGSFVSDKELPGDYDACWDWHGVDPSKLDPALLDFSPAGRIVMKAKYFGDIFLAGTIEGSTGLPFVDFFQQTRNGSTKGIVSLDPRSVP